MRHSDLHPSSPNDATPVPTGDGEASSRPRLLLVEDDEAIRQSLGEALQDNGFEVATAGNGCEALGLLRSTPRPAAILLDLMMPVMDGWDFRQEQLADSELRDVPVVVVTAAGFSEETIRLQFGDVQVIPKPVPYLTLLTALGRACGASVAA
jgi:CheY-like chemotaxis protein